MKFPHATKQSRRNIGNSPPDHEWYRLKAEAIRADRPGRFTVLRLNSPDVHVRAGHTPRTGGFQVENTGSGFFYKMVMKNLHFSATISKDQMK